MSITTSRVWSQLETSFFSEFFYFFLQLKKLTKRNKQTKQPKPKTWNKQVINLLLTTTEIISAVYFRNVEIPFQHTLFLWPFLSL